MRTLIRRYQSGGEALPLVDYVPFEGLGSSSASSETSTKSTTSSSNEDEVGVKDLLKLASSLDGLPSDISKITKMISNMYKDASLFSADGKLSTDNIVTNYLSALQQIKVAGFNKNEFNEAKSEVIKNGGLHEAAIDEYGNVLVLNIKDGDIKRMSVKDYFQNADTYTPLTNSNLLYYRANSKQLSFDNRYLDVVSNGIGEEKITSMIQKVLAGIGNDTLEKQGYTLKLAGDIKSGIELLAQAHNEGLFSKTDDLMPIDSLYKLGMTTLDLQNQINLALNYLMKAMPANAKSWLALKALNVKNPTQGAKDMVANLMFAHDSSTKKFDISPMKDPNTKEKEPKDEWDVKLDKSTPYTSLQKQEGGTTGTFELNRGTNNSMMVLGTVYGSLQDAEWKPISNTSMANVLAGGLSSIVQNMNGISFGDRVISPEDLNNIMYDGGGGMMVNLPCKTVNGAKVVDLQVLDEYNKAYEEFKNQQVTQENAEQVFGKILYEHGLSDLLDANGLPNKNRFNQFLVVTGYGVDKDHKFFKNTDGDSNDYLEDIDTDDAGLVDLIEKSLSSKNKEDSTKRDYKIDTESWFESSSNDSPWFTYDHIYKGSLYIPISNNEAQGLNASKQETPTKILHQREYEYQLLLKRQNAQSASADLLN